MPSQCIVQPFLQKFLKMICHLCQQNLVLSAGSLDLLSKLSLTLHLQFYPKVIGVGGKSTTFFMGFWIRERYPLSYFHK